MRASPCAKWFLCSPALLMRPFFPWMVFTFCLVMVLRAAGQGSTALADQNSKTGWFGYDFIVNKKVIDSKATTLLRYDAKAPGDHWVTVAKVNYRYKGNKLEVAIRKHTV